jgi:site-specific recombinase XerC
LSPAANAVSAASASELTGIRYHAGDAERSDLDLRQREITVRGKNGKARIVKIGYQTARTPDRECACTVS